MEFHIPARSLRQIGTDLETTWRERLDRTASASLANEACIAIRHSKDPSVDYPGVLAAAEFYWDTGADLFNARRLVDGWRQRVYELTKDWGAADALAPRSKALLLEARLALRANEYAEAKKRVDAAGRQLRQLIGGEPRLRRLIDSPEPSRAIDLYSSILATEIPVLRVDRNQWPVTSQLLDIRIQDAVSIIEGGHPYERLHPLVRQTFFAVADRRDPCDRDLVHRLYEKDVQLRSSCARARCTYPLVDMVLAQFHGDVSAELAAACLAERELRRAGLNRLIRTLNARGWWKLRPAA
jgi:hypothetical protein